MRNSISLLCLFCFIGSVPAMAQNVNEDWVAVYDGTNHLGDRANCLAIDPDGNIVVAGHTWEIGELKDYKVVKYSPEGSILWDYTHLIPDYLNDTPEAMVLDTSGNIYVTGAFEDSLGQPHDYTNVGTIKLFPDGNLAWAREWTNNAIIENDRAFAICVDDVGDIYVTGYTALETVGEYNILTIKYSATGGEVWVSQYLAPIPGEGWALDILWHESGYVYVTGYSAGTGTDLDVTTIKYDAQSGGEIWDARYNGPENGVDKGAAITMDSQGDIYVTGIVDADGAEDFITIKYNSDGDTLWTARYEGPANGWDQANSIEVDCSGNILVAGHSEGNGDQDFTLLKYNSDGDLLWEARYDNEVGSDDRPNDMIVDAYNSIYLTGNCGQGYSLDYLTVKIDSSGIVQWAINFDSGGTGSTDQSNAIALDDSGHVYVTGYIESDSTSDDWTTIRYSQGPTAVQQIKPTPVTKFILSQSFPNPFNPSTVLSYQMQVAGHVNLAVYDVQGHQVAELIDGWRGAGEHEVTFDGSDLPSGIYLYRLTAGEFSDAGKMVLMK